MIGDAKQKDKLVYRIYPFLLFIVAIAGLLVVHVIRDDKGGFNIFLLIILAIISLLFLLGPLYVAYSVDCSDNSVVIKRRYIFKGKKEERVRMNRIVAVWRGYRIVHTKSGSRRKNQLFLVLDDGSVILVGDEKKKALEWIEEKIQKQVEDKGRVEFNIEEGGGSPLGRVGRCTVREEKSGAI